MTIFNNAIRIIQAHSSKDVFQIMQQLKVDPYGIRIMVPKGINRLIRINSVPGIAANILKQEMLSLGAECALPKEALVSRNKKTDCLLIGTLSQFQALIKKLKRQPFALSKLADDLAIVLKNHSRDEFSIKMGKYKLSLGKSPCIMGIVNITPDSFSGDGLYHNQIEKWENQRLDYIAEYALKLVKDGADILDIGGESSHPGAAPVSLKDELKRTIPVIKILSKKTNVPISIDTYKPEVAKAALDNGAVMINDITGLKNPQMAKLIARYDAACVIMHMKGSPRTMQKAPTYKSLIDEIILFHERAIKAAIASGVNPEKIIIDPGIGFGKTVEHNLEILKQLETFKSLGRPIMIGPSRKSFIGKILNLPADKRAIGTVAACILAVTNGANIVRVHDVKETYQALKLTKAILS